MKGVGYLMLSMVQIKIYNIRLFVCQRKCNLNSKYLTSIMSKQTPFQWLPIAEIDPYMLHPNKDSGSEEKEQ